MKVTVNRVDLGEREVDIYINSGRYTDILVTTDDGRHLYSRIPGWDSADSEGFQRAQFERRQRPGFYRVQG